MTGDELRERFLLFFEQKGHKRISSSSLVPVDDPTLLLTNAGMVQFKPYFTGEAAPPSPRLTSCQKCFRTTDIASVGNLKHLTFFEMLGNFSIGDYFKKESIAWAWEFVLEWLKLPEEKLWITIFLDDDESFQYWRDLGVRAERIVRCGEEDNFWGPAGEVGPCGPCSEIHYDLGEDTGCGRPDCSPACDCGRFLEIWNLVFTEYYQNADGKRTPLPKKNIDTGMGLERTAAVLQGARSPYATDLFAPVIQRISALAGRRYGADEKTDRAMRIVAEHGRAVTFLIADGVRPSNEGRGYVLRRVIRRAAYFGETLSRDKPFITEVAEQVIRSMGFIYPELVTKRESILKVVGQEVEKFREAALVGQGILEITIFKLRKDLVSCFPKFAVAFDEALSLNDILDLRDGINNSVDHFLRDCGVWEHALSVGGRDAVEETLKPVSDGLLALRQIVSNYDPFSSQNAFKKLKKDLRGKCNGIRTSFDAITREVSGYELFILHDTYGFPAELTAELAAERGISVDLKGFEAEMERQRERARAAHKFKLGDREAAVDWASMSLPPTEFVGYERTRSKAKVISLAADGSFCDIAGEGQQVEVVLDRTPFYAEMGGQVGDRGKIVGRKLEINISDSVQVGTGIVVHRGDVARGSVTVGEEVEAEVDESRRLDIARNHTATHLLHGALRQVLGEEVRQAGSLVAPDHFRFDFSQEAPVLKEELDRIQRIVNENVRRNLPVSKKDRPYKQAVAEGAIALFGEKYGDVVRTVKIGGPRSPVSFEVCGGTHVNRTGDIGFFHIISEGSIGSGMRRIEAVTGRGAETLFEERVSSLEKIAGRIQAPAADVEDKLEAILEELDSERKRAVALERQLSRENVESLLAQVRSVNGVSVLSARVSASNMDVLCHTGDLLKERLGSAVIVLGAVWDGRPNFLAMVTPDLLARGINAGEIVKKAAQETGGSGGGKPQMAQGGGKEAGKLEQALKSVIRTVEEKG